MKCVILSIPCEFMTGMERIVNDSQSFSTHYAWIKLKIFHFEMKKFDYFFVHIRLRFKQRDVFFSGMQLDDRL